MSAISNLDLEARVRLVDEAPTDDFAELIRIAGLDPKKHLRFADWSGVDFRGCDLRDFDFTGARLIGCNFEGARIKGARFDQALIDEVRPGAKLDPERTNLRAADDWKSYAKGWKRADRPAREHLPPGSIFQDAPFAPEMVVVPPGRFMMGSEGEEQHEVTIPQAFAVGRFPVTFDEWEAAHASGSVRRNPNIGLGRGRRPVFDVSWHDAKAYIGWLCGKTGKLYRLLSEAEWEYACRAEAQMACSFGESLLEAEAHSRTFDVGSFFANNFGLHDMPGDPQEWCEDRWHSSYAGKPESLKQIGGAWVAGSSGFCVSRGGTWQGSTGRDRSASWDHHDIGFRVARTIITS